MSLNERTDKKPYKSICSDLYIDAPNYLAELICQKKQEKDSAGSLPIKFWNSDKYKDQYIREVSQARNLLKKYPPLAIVLALKDYRARFITSLRNKNLIPIIESSISKIQDSEFIPSDNNSEEKVITKKATPAKKNIFKSL